MDYEERLEGPPTIVSIARLARLMALGEESEELSIAYEGIEDLRLRGFLVTLRGGLDRLIAFFPVGMLVPLALGDRDWGAHALAQMHRAARVAQDPLELKGMTGAIDLRGCGAGKEVPGWVFGLQCASLTRPWNGDLCSPRPFCPAMFASLARSPQTTDWLVQQATHGQDLPRRKRQVLQLLLRGKAERTIARELRISPHTVHAHVKAVYARLSVNSRAELLARCMPTAGERRKDRLPMELSLDSVAGKG